MTMFRLELEQHEVGVLLCLMRLGMDTFAAETVDMETLLRLDRLPAEAFKSLSEKLTAATDAFDVKVPLDRLSGLGSER